MRIVAGRIVTVGSWYLGIVWLLFLNKKIKIVKITYKKYIKKDGVKIMFDGDLQDKIIVFVTCLVMMYKIL